MYQTRRKPVELTPEAMVRIRGTKKSVEGQDSKNIYCPKCGRLLMRKYTDARGHIDCKCTKCGTDFVVDLFSWRRAR